ncbi:MAG: 2-C-methyl-D-erythritol 4-phosphate cytidylyltransferase [Acidimicrobiia bacterium]|nr:2-C-methyl-D-erythritol 4-phosphate cytidylyltransferase [Acidimicrobiia bacterium]
MQLAIVLGGGSGERSGVEGNKVLEPLAGVPVIRRSVDAVVAGGAERVVVVARPSDREAVAAALADVGVDVHIVNGGPTRHASEMAGLAEALVLGVTGADDVIAIHDGARPLVTSTLVATLFEVAGRDGSSWPALDQPALWAVEDGALAAPIAGRVQTAQTPQVARASVLHAAYDAAAGAGFEGTDTVETVQQFSDLEPTAVPGERTNVKITWPDDFAVAQRLLEDGRPADGRPVGSLIVSDDQAVAQAPTSTSEIDLAVLEAVERELVDAAFALDCLAVEGTAICDTCRAAEADGTLADRPSLARCVAAKRGV